MKRFFDLLSSFLLLVLFFLPFVFIGILILITSGFPILYWSERVGKSNKIFLMPKIRTMKRGTPQLASHLIDNADSFYTPLGKFLRQYSIDEIPQLFSVIQGNMSFVGPRPALFNQTDLIELRNKFDICTLDPGITGWAQVNGRDELSIESKVNFDAEYLKRKSFCFDLYIIWLTLLKVIKRDGVTH
tara:strand:- start:74 stop:634 length:561 start_codon:yes stop_codon:yes gene_type:complete